MKKLAVLILAMLCLLIIPAYATDMNEEILGSWYLDYIDADDGTTSVLADYGQTMDLAVYEDGTFVEMGLSFLQRGNKFSGTWEAYCNEEGDWYCNFIYDFSDGEEIADVQLIDGELLLYNPLAEAVYHYVREQKHDIEFYSGIDAEADMDSFDVNFLIGAAAIGFTENGSMVYRSMDALSMEAYITLEGEGEEGYLVMEKVNSDGSQIILEGPFEFGEDDEGYPCLLANIVMENGENSENPREIRIYRQKLYHSYLVMGHAPVMIASPEKMELEFIGN